MDLAQKASSLEQQSCWKNSTELLGQLFFLPSFFSSSQFYVKGMLGVYSAVSKMKIFRETETQLHEAIVLHKNWECQFVFTKELSWVLAFLLLLMLFKDQKISVSCFLMEKTAVFQSLRTLTRHNCAHFFSPLKILHGLTEQEAPSNGLSIPFHK